MCIAVIQINKKHKWPIIIGTNRDELFSRKSKFPGKHWKNQQNIIGGLDLAAGGTWCAINNKGVFGCILNRNFKTKKFTQKKTRGEIIIKALKGNTALESIKILKKINIDYYNGFNLIIADNKNFFWVKNIYSKKKLVIYIIPNGISIITNKDINDIKDKKINFYLKKFNKVKIPNIKKINWSKWENILLSKSRNNIQQNELICFNQNNYFGTVASSLIALSLNKNEFIYRHNDNPLNKNVYKEIKIR